MTNDEALALKPGDRVRTQVGHVWATARVERVISPVPEYLSCWRWRAVLAYVVREGRNVLGRSYPVLMRGPQQLTLIPRRDPTTANVFADWLEERGECRAAAMLREAFPRCPAAEAS